MRLTSGAIPGGHRPTIKPSMEVGVTRWNDKLPDIRSQSCDEIDYLYRNLFLSSISVHLSDLRASQQVEVVIFKYIHGFHN